MSARLPIEPLRGWIDARLAQLEAQANGRSSLQLLADELGVAERVLFRWREENEQADLDTVEDALEHAGFRIVDLYPELEIETVGERFCPRCHDTVTVSDDLRCPWCESPTEHAPAIAAKRYCPPCDRPVWPTGEGRCWRCDTPVVPIPWDPCRCGCGTLVHRFARHGRRVRYVLGHNPRSRERDHEQPIGPFAEWLRAELRNLDPIEALAKRTGLARADLLYVLNERGPTFSRRHMQRALWITSRGSGGKGAKMDVRVPSFFDLYPDDARAKVCPECRGPKARASEICGKCRKRRNRAERRRPERPRRLSDELIREAYELYVGPPERGVREVADMIVSRTPYTSGGLAFTLRTVWLRNGWDVRSYTTPRNRREKAAA